MTTYETARELALAWIATGNWGDPNCSDAFAEFYTRAEFSDELADALVTNRSDVIIIRAYAARLVGQFRRALAFDPMPAQTVWPVVEEDGA
jgi:hypothetical protein